LITETSFDLTESFKRMLADQKQDKYVLRLYVAGMTARSMSAISSLKELCEERFPDRYELEIINLLEHPELAETQEIIASPTLVKELPQPEQRLVGDMTNPERVLSVLK